jgi:hypothetical protein
LCRRASRLFSFLRRSRSSYPSVKRLLTITSVNVADGQRA